MSMIEDIKRDREAGTPGPWTAPSKPVFGDYCGSYVPHDWDGMGRLAVFHVTAGPEHAAPNTRRIARVPDIEAALIAADDLANALDQERNMVCQDMGMQADCAARVDATLAAYRAATGAA